MGGKGAVDLALGDGQGQVLRHEIYVVDLTERERESRSEEDLARDDPLTLQNEGARRSSLGSAFTRTHPAPPTLCFAEGPSLPGLLQVGDSRWAAPTERRVSPAVPGIPGGRLGK
jgi:hypothetical protein